MRRGSLPAAPGRGRLGRVLAFATAISVFAALTGAGHPVDAAPNAPAASLGYRLADTWSGIPAQPVAGRFERPLDISSAPDGAIYVLDRVRGLHVLQPSGSPRALWPLGGWFSQAPVRVDVGYDGVVAVLGQDANLWRVVRLAPGGAELTSFRLATAGTAADVAVAPGGNVYVSMSTVTGDVDRIDVYAPDGTPVDRIVPGRTPSAGPDGRFTYELQKLDIGPTGEVNVIAYAWRVCPPAPTARPQPTRTPAPTATPRPSLADAVPSPGDASPAQALPCNKQIVLVFGADHRFREEVPNPHQEDIAAGAEGVIVSTNAGTSTPAVYRLGAPAPAFTYGESEARLQAVSDTAGPLQLDVDRDGRVLVASGGRDAFFEGASVLGSLRRGGAGSKVVPSALGIADVPPLAGPMHPAAIDAAGEVVLLDLPYQRGADDVPRTAVDAAHEVSAVQRWTFEGVPYTQAVHFGNMPSALYYRHNGGGQLVDVATDGLTTFAISANVLWVRQDALAPRWHRAQGSTYLSAVSARAGFVALLDAAGQRVMLLDDTGDLQYAWSYTRAAVKVLAGDIAFGLNRIYLADQGRNRIMVRGIRGQDLGEWPTLDGPLRISVAPDGDVFVLGRGGYALRYTPTGQLVAAWRVPATHDGREATGRDIAVGDDGRVYVSFFGLTDPGDGGTARGYAIGPSGVWVFEPFTVEEPALPGDRAACLTHPDKVAAPRLVLLGETVGVTLTVEGLCPGRYEPQQIVIVLDTSWSMHDNYPRVTGPGALRRAKAVLGATLSALDPQAAELGLVTFSTGAGVAVALPGDLDDVRGHVLSAVADGDSRMGAGIDLAHRMLRGTAGRPDVKQTILVVSDGVFKDDPGAPIAAATADGIEIVLLVLTTAEFDAAARARLYEVAPDASRVFVDPSAEAARGLVDKISAYVPNSGLFETIAVDDVVPANMEVLPGSIVPPAEWDASTRTLTWTLGPVAAADGVQLRYRLLPRAPGYWRTNVGATARYRDVLGVDGRLRFPVPWVTVLQAFPLPTPTPIATSTATSTPSATATSTATSTSTATPRPTPTATGTGKPYRLFLPLVARVERCLKVSAADIVIILDVSTSMRRASPGGGTKLDGAVAAARLFTAEVRDAARRDGRGDQAAVVAFNESAWTVSALTDDWDRLDRDLGTVASEMREGTRLDLALDEAARVLSMSPRRADNWPVMILLTDGLPNRVPTPAPVGGQEDTVLEVARRAKDAGIEVFTIGLGESGDIRAWMLRAAASDPSWYYETPDAGDLAAIYAHIARVVTCDRRPGPIGPWPTRTAAP